MWVCAHECNTGQDQKRELDLLELKLQVIVRQVAWATGTKLGPLREQQVLLVAEPPLQPHTSSLIAISNCTCIQVQRGV